MGEKISRHINLKSICQVVALGLTALTIGPPLINIDNTTRALQAIFTGVESCISPVPENHSVGYLFDAIVVPGAVDIRTKDGTYEPGDQGKVRLEAAAIAYYYKMAPYIVLLNGKTIPNDGEDTQLRFLQHAYRRLTGYSQNIPPEVIFTENRSVNTATDMDELVTMATPHQIRSALIVDSKYHAARSTLFARRRGIAASCFPAENIFLQEHPEYADVIREMYATKSMEDAQRKEEIELILAIWDPDAIIPTYLRKNGWEYGK